MEQTSPLKLMQFVSFQGASEENTEVAGKNSECCAELVGGGVEKKHSN